MILTNGFVFNEDGSFSKRDVFIDDKNIICELNNLLEAKEKILSDINSNIYSSDEKIQKNKEVQSLFETIDAEENYIIPGLIDTHIHGAKGYDFCDNSTEGLEIIAKYLKSVGVTSFCPTSMTLEKSLLKEIFKTATQKFSSECSNIVGIHMEGPFLSLEKKGAQNPKYISKPDIDIFNELNDACNNIIKIITIAPEYKNSLDFIEEINNINKNINKISISLGHTTASYDLASRAIQKGANRATHLFNAMSSFSHRDTGVVGACFDNSNSFVELICDGVHVHESMVRATFKMFPDRVVLISDGIMATGMQDGNYNLGGQKVVLKDNIVTLKDGTIAGSATNLMQCVKKAVIYGIPFGEAIKAGSVTPSKSIGIYEEVGSIDIGKRADILIIDKDRKSVV